MATVLAATPTGGIARFALPVSGIVVVLLAPTGREDLLLSEHDGSEDEALLSLARRLSRSEDGEEIAWPELTPTDLDTLLLRLRQAVFGDRIVGDLYCVQSDCGSRIDIAFSIEAYLARHRPMRPLPQGRGWHVAAAAEWPGWFSLAAAAGAPDLRAAVRFRLPTVADQIAARRQIDPAAALAEACIDPPGAGAPLRRRVERALEAMAPLLEGELEGQCPTCGAVLRAAFQPRHYCLQELRERARFVYRDVDVLARRYHWAEDSILGMPSARRALYADLAEETLQ